MKTQPQIQALQAKLQAIHSSRTPSGSSTELVEHPRGLATELTQVAGEGVIRSDLNKSDFNRSDPKANSAPTGSTVGRSPQRTAAPMVELRPTGKAIPNPTANLDPVKRSPASSAHIVSTVEDLNQRSNQYLQQFQAPLFLQPLPTQPQTAPPPRPSVYLQKFEQKLADLMQQLEAQADQINQLSQAQEGAVHELRAIAQRAEREWRALELDGKLPFDWETYLPTFECIQAAVPLVQRDADGTFILTAKPVDLYQAEREAASTAEALRQRSVSGRDRAAPEKIATRRSRKSSKKSAPLGFLKPLLTFLQESSNASAVGRPPHSSQVREAQWDASNALTMPEAAMWLIGAIVARGGINLVLSAVPGLWLLMVGLMVVPAAIAIYRITTSPQSSFVWGCRLFLAMVGLLIGGRLL